MRGASPRRAGAVPRSGSSTKIADIITLGKEQTQQLQTTAKLAGPVSSLLVTRARLGGSLSTAGVAQLAQPAQLADGLSASDGTESWFGGRQWAVAPADASEAAAGAVQFRLMSFNTLAQDYAQRYATKLYREVPSFCLTWQHRFPLLVKELLFWQPDVVCLQEVQCFQELHATLALAGYKGTFLQRGGRRKDGCATFWKADKFTLVEATPLRFSEVKLEDNVALIVRLKPLQQSTSAPEASQLTQSHSPETVDVQQQPTQNHIAQEGQQLMESQQLCDLQQQPPDLLVSNTHICFDPAKGHIKLGQIRVLFETVHRLATTKGPAVAILAGDYNTAPHSPLYQFMSQGSLDISRHCRAKMSGQKKGWGYPEYFRSAAKKQALLQQLGLGSDATQGIAGLLTSHPSLLGTAAVPHLHHSHTQPQPLSQLAGTSAPGGVPGKDFESSAVLDGASGASSSAQWVPGHQVQGAGQPGSYRPGVGKLQRCASERVPITIHHPSGSGNTQYPGVATETALGAQPPQCSTGQYPRMSEGGVLGVAPPPVSSTRGGGEQGHDGNHAKAGGRASRAGNNTLAASPSSTPQGAGQGPSSTQGTLSSTQGTLSSTQGPSSTQGTLSSTQGPSSTQGTLSSTQGTLSSTQGPSSTQGTLSSTQGTLSSTQGTSSGTPLPLSGTSLPSGFKLSHIQELGEPVTEPDLVADIAINVLVPQQLQQAAAGVHASKPDAGGGGGGGTAAAEHSKQRGSGKAVAVNAVSSHAALDGVLSGPQGTVGGATAHLVHHHHKVPAGQNQGLLTDGSRVSALLPDGSRLDVDVQLQPPVQQQALPGQQGGVDQAFTRSTVDQSNVDRMGNTPQAPSAGLLSAAGAGMSALMHAAQSRLNTWLGPAANKGWGDKALRSALGPAGAEEIRLKRLASIGRRSSMARTGGDALQPVQQQQLQQQQRHQQAVLAPAGNSAPIVTAAQDQQQVTQQASEHHQGSQGGTAHKAEGAASSRQGVAASLVPSQEPGATTTKQGQQEGKQVEGAGEPAEEEEQEWTSALAQHPLKVLSTYQAATGSEPAFTSTHHQYHGTCDFLWFSPHPITPALQHASNAQQPSPSLSPLPTASAAPADLPPCSTSTSSSFPAAGGNGQGQNQQQQDGCSSQQPAAEVYDQQQQQQQQQHLHQDTSLQQPAVQVSDQKQQQQQQQAPFHSSWHLRPVRVLAPPPMSHLPKGLPAPLWPSDHIPLVANYVLAPVTQPV